MTLFVSDAVVTDEGNTYRGRDAIRQWNIKTNAKYQTQMKPLEISENNNLRSVAMQMTGNFPGSPVVATFIFEIKDSKIAALAIH